MPPKFPFRMFFGINLILIRNYLKLKERIRIWISILVRMLHGCGRDSHLYIIYLRINGPKLNYIYFKQYIAIFKVLKHSADKFDRIGILAKLLKVCSFSL